MQIEDCALSFTRLQWIRERKKEGMKEEEAAANWTESINSGEFHVVTMHGEKQIIEQGSTKISNIRSQAWKRSVQNEKRALTGADEIQGAFKVARTLADWDICSEAAFANAGGRLLRKPGSVPSLPDAAAERCPLLPQPPPGAAEPSLSQELASADQGSAAPSAAGSRKPAAHRNPGTTQLLARQHALNALKDRMKSLTKARKTVEKVSSHKNWAVPS